VHIVQADADKKGVRRPSRARAWYNCVAAGRRVGIPDHGWRKRHVYHEDGSATWCWYTAEPEALDQQTEMLREMGAEA